METKEKLLEVIHLKQYFRLNGKQVLKAVDDISFDVYKGEVFGIVGESGCGKTTTGRAIIRLYEPTAGVVRFKGETITAGVQDLKDEKHDLIRQWKAERKGLNQADRKQLDETYRLKFSYIQNQFSEIKWNNRHKIDYYVQAQLRDIEAQYKRKLKENPSLLSHAKMYYQHRKQVKQARRNKLMTKMQMIFQDPIASLDPRMTVYEIIAEGLIIRGVKDKKLITQKVHEVLQMVGLLPEHASRYPHEFSGGQRQRIGIARAIIMNPELIIADEPISALDVSIQAQVMNLLNDLRQEMNLTIIFIAHNLSVVKYFSDRIAVMYFGKIVELATSEELFSHPLHPYTKSLLSAIPLPDPFYEKNRKRIHYNPVLEHHYETDLPSLKEINTGHFVYCNQEEYKKYKEELKND